MAVEQGSTAATGMPTEPFGDYLDRREVELQEKIDKVMREADPLFAELYEIKRTKRLAAKRAAKKK